MVMLIKEACRIPLYTYVFPGFSSSDSYVKCLILKEEWDLETDYLLFSAPCHMQTTRFTDRSVER